MKYAHYYCSAVLLSLMVYCSPTHRPVTTTQDNTSNNSASNENISLLVVKTSRFVSVEAVELHIVSVLTSWSMTYNYQDHIYTTNPKVIFNSIQGKFRIVVENANTFKITGEESVVGLGGISWQKIRKGPGSDTLGRPTYERMLALAQAMHADNIIYSTED